MKTIILFLFLLIVMSPKVKAIFSEICGMDVKYGTMDLASDKVDINAIAIDKNGIQWDVFCLWKNGAPQYITYENPEKVNSWL
jgi:hypothetical protein